MKLKAALVVLMLAVSCASNKPKPPPAECVIGKWDETKLGAVCAPVNN